jgi:hypothetical protein
MGCSCRDKKKFKVKLPGGLEVTKTTEAAAVDFASKHPGAKVVKLAS